MPDIRPHVEQTRALSRGPSGQIAAAAEPLPDFDDPAFGKLFDRFGDARVVLLGEATCGTSEFYRARAAITRWLVEKRGFNIVALDLDWWDGRQLDARVRGRAAASEAFAGLPAWAWKNREFGELLDWLRAYNLRRSERDQVGIRGLDLYGLAGPVRAAIDHLDRIDSDVAMAARERFGCPNPWAQEPQAHGRMAVSGRYANCEGAVTSMLVDRLAQQMRERTASEGDEALLDTHRIARLLGDAENYYRTMYYGGAEAWNQRATHMFETLQALLDARGPYARAVVWAHNAHVGDARATEMGVVRDEYSLGQLCRHALRQEVRLIGFGSHAGTVACGSDWAGPMDVKPLKPSLQESGERQAHNAGLERFLLDLRFGVNGGARRALADPRLERFVGVTYRPESERWSHYAECRLSEQYDAWVWFDQTTAVRPLLDVGDAWPFGS